MDFFSDRVLDSRFLNIFKGMGKEEQKTKHISGYRNWTLGFPVSALSQYVSCIFMEATEGKTISCFGSLKPDEANS